MNRSLKLLGIILLCALPAPIFIVIGASFNGGAYIQFPPESVSLRWYLEAFADPRWLDAFLTSFWMAAVTAIITTAVSFLTAYYVLRYAPRIASMLEIAIFSPLFFPHAAMGVALVALIAELGLLGRAPGIILAHLIVVLPFSYRPIYISLRSIDPDLMRAANVLGASEWRALKDIILPMCRSGILTSLLFSGIISFDEVTVTMFLIGPEITTLPVQIFTFIQDRASPVLAAISTISVIVTFLAVLILERVAGLAFFVQRDSSA
ncbi:ABC transporter permease subunit [Sneathiella chungangensis]|uniref:ABC transporter permease subunit n=1 Tax=Sneathiella chungangensis TaxID=1418234 RepID=A0A845M802_9PROT|nr:ABC transporter permease [Sneathiella chungangensis]MZR20918.1 ABC transporter permease subunit [Sneathiella chungangensis]